MVDLCANPGCARPLKYLRDGRIYIFEVSSAATDPNAKRLRHLEHYWLCGLCSETLILVQDDKGIHVAPKPLRIPEEFDSIESALAS